MAASTAKRSETAVRPLRADAQRNRARLLEAADVVFAERGAAASLEEIAQRAGVGIGTLYRHFATREALLAAACDDRLVAHAQQTRRRSASVDPLVTLRRFLVELCRLASMYGGLASSFGTVLQSGGVGCRATTAEGTRILETARSAGDVRGDVSFDEVVTVAAALSTASAGDELRLDKLIGVFVDGLRAQR